MSFYQYYAIPFPITMAEEVIYYSGRKIRSLTKLADRYEDVDAMFELGYRYYFGYGVRHNISKALGWFYNAAIRGDADACYMLGNMYSLAEGVDWDDEEAMYWFIQAADLGHADSMNELGIMFAEGYGVEANMEFAKEWWEKAVEAGSEEAKENLEKANSA